MLSLCSVAFAEPGAIVKCTQPDGSVVYSNQGCESGKSEKVKLRERRLIDLPEPYLVWFHAKGFPKGKLGEQLALMYEIKLNGLEGMVKKIK